MAHWTDESEEALINSITFDFIAQLERQIEDKDVKQSDLAQKLGVTEGAVSQVLNLNRMNLQLGTMARYARALGMKIAVVAYDDGDPENRYGPVGSELFSDAWRKLGKPRNVWELNQQRQQSYTDKPVCGVVVLTGDPAWSVGSINTTEYQVADLACTVGELAPLYAYSAQEQYGRTLDA